MEVLVQAVAVPAELVDLELEELPVELPVGCSMAPRAAGEL